MTDKILETGDTVQSLISQKGVQAIITLMVLATVLFMVAIGNPVPEWLKLMAFSFIGLYFEVPGKNGLGNSV